MLEDLSYFVLLSEGKDSVEKYFGILSDSSQRILRFQHLVGLDVCTEEFEEELLI